MFCCRFAFLAHSDEEKVDETEEKFAVVEERKTTKKAVQRKKRNKKKAEEKQKSTVEDEVVFAEGENGTTAAPESSFSDAFVFERDLFKVCRLGTC